MNRHRLILAAMAGVAMTVSGCAHVTPAAVAPVHPVGHLVSHVEAHAARAKHRHAVRLAPRAALAKAIRTTIAAHSAAFREVLTAQGAATGGTNPNPQFTVAGVMNFDQNTAELHFYSGPHASQPQFDSLSEIIQGGTVYVGNPAAFVNDASLTQAAVTACNTVEAGVAVLQDIKGKVRRLGKNFLQDQGPTLFTHYQAHVDYGQQLLDCSNGTDTLGKELLGALATENVWVDPNGRIAQWSEVVDLGQVQIPGLPSSWTTVSTTMQFTGYGEGTLVALPNYKDKTYALTAALR